MKKNKLSDTTKLTDVELSNPITESLEKYLNGTENPYCLNYGEITVRLRFAENERTLASCLINYFKNLKNQ